MTTESNKAFISPWWFFYAIAVLGLPIYQLVNYMEEPEDYGIIPNFSLENHVNEAFDLKTIDQPMVVNFIFTRCQNVCPTLTAKMATLQGKIDKEDALLLSITVDPKYDVPKVLNEYALKFQADSTRWFFLTGEEQDIRKIIGSFQQTYERIKDNDDVPNILHSEKFILLDKEAHIRGFFDDDPKGLNRLIRTITAL